MHSWQAKSVQAKLEACITLRCMSPINKNLGNLKGNIGIA